MTEPADAETPQPGISAAFAAAQAEAEATREAETDRDSGRPAGRVAGWLASDRVARRGLVLALVAAVVAAVALVGVVRHDARPRAEVGDVFDIAYAQDELPHRTEVLLPWTRLDVAAGDVRDELPELLNAPSNLRAPAGGSFVRVEVGLADDGLIPLAAVAAPFTQETEVTLRADGREYPVTGPGGLALGPQETLAQGGEVWVAVEGAPQDLEVLVTVDGLTQVVHASDGTVDAGRAAALADLPSQEDLAAERAESCGPTERVDTSNLEITYPGQRPCRVTLSLRTPFVDGLGWAEPGREFLVVHVAVADEYADVRRPGAPLERLTIGEAELDGRVDGEVPLGRSDVNALNQGLLAITDPDNPDQLVFDVPDDAPTGDLRLEAALRVTAGAPFVTERATIELRWTVPGEELA